MTRFEISVIKQQWCSVLTVDWQSLYWGLST
jgi:hypothetical protein